MSYRGVNTQDSFPSGSAMTTQLASPLADVDASSPEGDETVDLRLLITVDGWSEVEMQSGTSRSSASLADRPR